MDKEDWQSDRDSTEELSGMPEYEHRLREEIRFWEYMLDRCKKNGSADEIPKVLEALALAEFQLAKLTEAREKTRWH